MSSTFFLKNINYKKHTSINPLNLILKINLLALLNFHPEVTLIVLLYFNHYHNH